MILPTFYELLVPSTLISLSKSHAFREESSMNKIFMIQE